MDRSKIVAIVTGAIALLLSIAYLLVVQFLDLRGEMIPAPQDLSSQIETQSPIPQSYALIACGNAMRTRTLNVYDNASRTRTVLSPQSSSLIPHPYKPLLKSPGALGSDIQMHHVG